VKVPKLVFVFDWDYTLGPSTWDYIRGKFGILDDVMEKYRKWKSGDLSLDDWTEDDFQDLKRVGFKDGENKIFEEYVPFSGAKELISKINNLKFHRELLISRLRINRSLITLSCSLHYTFILAAFSMKEISNEGRPRS